MANELQLAPLSLPADGLQSYLVQVNGYPLLSKEEEAELSIAYRQHNDLKAAQKLVLSHLRYVVRIARGYMGYGLAINDLIQEGSIGLMKAVKRFDPDKGFRLVSFAVHWIKSEIHEYVIKNWRIVKIATTKSQRKLFFNLRKSKKRLGWFSSEEVKSLASDLGVSEHEVLEMESRLNNYDMPFDAPDDDDEDFFAPSHYISQGESEDPANLVATQSSGHSQNQQLQLAIEHLDSRAQEIVKSRWLSDKKLTLKALSEKFQVSIERIRQLEKSAMEKMHRFISEA